MARPEVAHPAGRRWPGWQCRFLQVACESCRRRSVAIARTFSRPQPHVGLTSFAGGRRNLSQSRSSPLGGRRPPSAHGIVFRAGEREPGGNAYRVDIADLAHCQIRFSDDTGQRFGIVAPAMPYTTIPLPV